MRLDELVARRRRARAPHAPGVASSATLEPASSRAFRARLDRAVTNLLDNAAKWSPPGGRSRCALRGGELRVRDHGAGIDADGPPARFDRFYRAPTARGRAGLGARARDRPAGRRGATRIGGSREPARAAARACACGFRGSWLDEALADRVADQLDAIAHAELGRGCSVRWRLDGLLADHEHLGDVARRCALRRSA